MVEFGTCLRARLARRTRGRRTAARGGSSSRLISRLFYELMTREAFVFSDFKPTAPRPKGKLAQRLS